MPLGDAPTLITVDTEFNSQGEPEPQTLVVDGERLKVLGIGDKWYEVDARYFKILASDGHLYLLRLDLEELSWSLVRIWHLDG